MYVMKMIIFGANEVGSMIASQFYTTNDITIIDDENINELDEGNNYDPDLDILHNYYKIIHV